MIAAYIEYAVPSEEVEIAPSIPVPELRTSSLREHTVKSDQFDHAGEAMVHVARIAFEDLFWRFQVNVMRVRHNHHIPRS
jgi:hypothetical protein